MENVGRALYQGEPGVPNPVWASGGQTRSLNPDCPPETLHRSPASGLSTQPPWGWGAVGGEGFSGSGSRGGLSSGPRMRHWGPRGERPTVQPGPGPKSSIARRSFLAVGMTLSGLLLKREKTEIRAWPRRALGDSSSFTPSLALASPGELPSSPANSEARHQPAEKHPVGRPCGLRGPESRSRCLTVNVS